MADRIGIVGGGIVGLATALRLKEKSPHANITLFEKEDRLAAHQTGHNSGVIHSGIYYKPGSLKAINCISGYNRLIEFCQEENVPYELCGKVIVATSMEEVPQLNILFDRGVENGLEGLRKLTADELKEREPYVNGVAGIFVPQTGIINYKGVADKYGEKLHDLGATIKLGERVKSISFKKQVVIETLKGDYEFDLVINCAGLYSDKVAQFVKPDLPLRIIPFRGEYYKLKKEKEYLVKNLIYPVPDPNFPFLGVHFTRMINGGIEAGPNAVLAFKREGYRKSDFDLEEFREIITWPGFQKVASKYWKTGMGELYRSFSKSAFVKALQKLLPEIQSEDIMVEGAGVRAQACDRSGGLLDDFSILEDDRVINVCNAPSPAATSSLAIGETVSSLAIDKLK